MSKPWVPPKEKQYPLWYFNRSGVDKAGRPLSDGPWVLRRMKVIPAEHKDKIANRYEDIYQNKNKSGNRKRANTFLNKIARWFHTNYKYPKVEQEFTTPAKQEFITQAIVKGPGIDEMKQKLRALNEKRKR